MFEIRIHEYWDILSSPSLKKCERKEWEEYCSINNTDSEISSFYYRGVITSQLEAKTEFRNENMNKLCK